MSLFTGKVLWLKVYNARYCPYTSNSNELCKETSSPLQGKAEIPDCYDLTYITVVRD